MNDLPGSLVGGSPLRIGERVLGGTPGDYLKVDANKKLTQGAGIDEIDGGFANSVYLISQLFDGGSA